MKYYGFKFKKSVVDSSNFNPNVATWIGVMGTFIFIALAATNGSFKGRIGVDTIVLVAHPAIMWFLSLLSIERQWARKVLLAYALVSSVLTIALIAALWIGKQFVPAVLLLLFLLNVGVPFLMIDKKRFLWRKPN